MNKIHVERRRIINGKEYALGMILTSDLDEAIPDEVVEGAQRLLDGDLDFLEEKLNKPSNKIAKISLSD